MWKMFHLGLPLSVIVLITVNAEVDINKLFQDALESKGNETIVYSPADFAELEKEIEMQYGNIGESNGKETAALSRTELVDFEKSFSHFACKLYGSITESEGNENVVFSPASVQTAAVLAFLGAGGETETDMASGLSLPTTDKNIVANAFGELLLKYNNHPMVTFEQKLYIKEGVFCSSNFEEIANQSLTTNVESINFSNNKEAAIKINDWVNSKTHGKIETIVEEDSLNEDTVGVIVNALYLKGLWQTPFPKNNTRNDKFWIDENNTIEVDFMTSTAEFEIQSSIELHAEIIKLPFENSKLSMLLILPNEDDGLRHVEDAMKNNQFESLSGFQKERVQLTIPKFKAELEMKLTGIFKKMGMTSMFHGANFTGISQDFEVSEIIHKAVLEVTEEGAEAATVTAMRMGRSSPITFFADHPFMYLITGESNEVLFAGRFVKP